MNILFFLVDQMRYDALSCNGAPVCRTPNLDALAAEGTRFSSAYTTTALCSPARASVLTGLYPHNHGQLANVGNFNGVFDNCVLGRETYFSKLKAHGYQTGYVGKWHLEKDGEGDFWGIDRWHTSGEYFSQVKKDGAPFDFGIHEVQPLEWGPNAPFQGVSVMDAEHHHDGWVARRTVDLLEEMGGQDAPFAVCAAFHGPHFPYAVPEPYYGMYRPEDVPRWENFGEMFKDKPIVQQKELMRWNTAHLTWQDWQKVIAVYWGYCTYIDAQIGLVMDALKAKGLYEDTMIVFTSDHGDMLGSHRLFNKGFNMYEETHHIPFIMRVPGAPAVKECGAFVSLVDLMPTFMEAAGDRAACGADGQSMLPLLATGTAPDWRTCLLAEFNGYESTLLTMRMVRTDKWKYVYNPFAEDELYDMGSDPGELHNLAPMVGFTHVLRRMRSLMFQQLRAYGDGIVDETNWQSNAYGLFVSPREC